MRSQTPISGSVSSTLPTEELTQFYFHQGTGARAHRYLGAHPTPEGGWSFRVWAPHAEFVSLCGDLNGWDRGAHPLQRISSEGIWELRLPPGQATVGQCYKYFLSGNGWESLKADPFARFSEDPPGTASVIGEATEHPWRDAGWMDYRRALFSREKAPRQPLNIYQIDPLTWQRSEDDLPLSFAALGRELASYAKQMGYTHVELLSAGTQCSPSGAGRNLFSPTAGQGGPEGLAALVDSLHEAGMGVILGWNPLYFPADEPGLARFDGSPLYEIAEGGRAPEGTRLFDIRRPEVRSYLISNAVYWVEEYHLDGLHLPSLSPMLYLDYGKAAGEWIPNRFGDSRDLDAVAFFQQLNSRMSADHPDVLMIAEEASGWPHVTGRSRESLGFTLLWQREWQRDALSYLREDPLWRRHHHEKLCTSLGNALRENDLLPIGHRDVGEGEPSLLERSPGSYGQKFAGVRTFLTYQMTHPGKKLLFMGSEYGVFRSWHPAAAPEWFMTEFDMHGRLQLFVAALNRLYLEEPALWERDPDPGGFAWIDPNNREQSVYSYRRMDREGRELIILLNFLPVKREEFRLAVPVPGIYEEIFNSDAPAYGGQGILNSGKYKTEPYYAGEYGHAIRITVPPTGALIFRCTGRASRKSGGTRV